MIPMLYQVAPYPPLEEEDVHKEIYIYLIVEDVPHTLIEYVMDDVSSSD